MSPFGSRLVLGTTLSFGWSFFHQCAHCRTRYCAHWSTDNTAYDGAHGGIGEFFRRRGGDLRFSGTFLHDLRFEPNLLKVQCFSCSSPLAEFFRALPWPRSFLLARSSQRLAQVNSIARMASPAGMTINAGPGKTSNANPTSNTPPPTTAMAIRLAFLKVSLSAISAKRCSAVCSSAGEGVLRDSVVVDLLDVISNRQDTPCTIARGVQAGIPWFKLGNGNCHQAASFPEGAERVEHLSLSDCRE